MKTKLKNAPHLNEQKNDGAELLVLIVLRRGMHGIKAMVRNGYYWRKPYAPTRKKNL